MPYWILGRVHGSIDVTTQTVEPILPSEVDFRPFFKYELDHVETWTEDDGIHRIFWFRGSPWAKPHDGSIMIVMARGGGAF